MLLSSNAMIFDKSIDFVACHYLHFIGQENRIPHVQFSTAMLYK